MKFPMFKVHIDKVLALKHLSKVLESGYLNEGEQVNELTDFFKNYFNEDHVVLTNSCTSSLTLALKLAGVKPGDEVITTAMTCLASNTPVNNLGGKIVWADIDKNTGCISPRSVEKRISQKTKAVICVNWAGIPCDLEALSKICKENNIKLIQDAAHSLGSKINNKNVSKFADYTCYSFQAIKHVTTGDGGAIICKDKKDYELCKKLKWFGLDRDAAKDKKGEWKGQRWECDVLEAGYKFHMNNISAAIGLSQVKHVKDIVEAHKNNGKKYNQLLKENSNIKLLKITDNLDPAYWVYTCLLDKSINRDKVIQKLNEIGINAGLVHIPNHRYTCFKHSYCELPNTDYFHKHQISLPCGWWLNKKDIQEICDCLFKIINNSKIV